MIFCTKIFNMGNKPYKSVYLLYLFLILFHLDKKGR
jgi:hypothetical protein